MKNKSRQNKTHHSPDKNQEFSINSKNRNIQFSHKNLLNQDEPIIGWEDKGRNQ
jgi:hypothetical protein